MTRFLLKFSISLLVTGFVLARPTDSEFEKILDRYFEIQASLASDSTDGIAAASQEIDRLASRIQTENAKIEELASSLRKAAREIQGKDIEGARESFFEMSKPLLMFLHQFYTGDKEYFRYYCSMAKKGWIQPEKGTRNPYHGSSMLTCGELIE